MANDFKIHIPPADKSFYSLSALTKADRDLLDVYIMTGLKFPEVWMAFRKDKGTAATERAKANAFFATHDAQDYLEHRFKQITEYLSPVSDDGTCDDGSADKNLKDIISNKDVSKIIDLLKGYAEDPSSEFHFDALKLVANKSLAKMDLDDGLEPPRRYLPVTCDICSYKRFVEQECDDDCDRCKYKKYANENGVKYAPQNQLE